MLRRLIASLSLLVALSCSSPAVIGGIDIDPDSAVVVRHGTVTFTAIVSGSTDARVTWSVLEGASGGSIDANGTYSAPEATGRYHVVATLVADASQTASATVVVTSDAVALRETTPKSPANENAPHVKGSAPPGTTVKLYAKADCSGTPLGAGVAKPDGAFDVTIAVGDDTTTALHATVTTASGVTSECTDGALTYVEDSTPPAAPTLERVLPGPVADDNAPRFLGAAEAGSTVRLFSDPACTITAAEGTAAEFASSGIAVSVADDATITVSAKAIDAAGNVSSCSASSLTYREKTEQQQQGWRGPQARVELVPGSSEAFLVVGGQRYRPVFLSVNPQAIQTESGWAPLLEQIDLAAAQGMPIVDLMLGNKTVRFLQELSQRLGNRQVYLWLRFDMWIPEFANLGVPLLKNLAGVEQPGYLAAHAVSREGRWSTIPFYTTLDQAWLDAEKQALRTLLDDLNDSGLAERVIGVRTTYMAGGEWFQPPLAFHDNTLDDVPPNKWPWSHPDAFSLGDYSSRERGEFSQWLQAKGLGASTPFPEPADRIQPRMGRTFNVGEDGSNVASVLYRRFVAERVARFQSELARVAKEATQSKVLVMINNGYLYSLCFYNGSFHTAFDQVLDSPYIDAISSPYNYNTLGSRKPGFALIAHGPMDSPALHGKLWIHEDDSRPYWSSDGFRATTTWAEDRSLMLRNAVTSLLHGNALYYFDLPNQGWYGVGVHAGEIRSVYETLRAFMPKLSGQLARNGSIPAEIAIFVDDDSYHLYPEFGMDGAASYGTSNELLVGMVEKISKAGAPVRYYLLDDLANPNLDVSAVKLAFFLNTPKLTQAQRQAIRTRLMNNGRVLYFQHAAGFFDETNRPSWTLAQEFSPGVSGLAQIEASTSHAVTVSDRGSYAIAYSPRGASEAEVNALLTRASVHRYASNAVVDGAGNVLMVHSAGGAVSVQLKSAAKVVDLLTDAVLCQSCTSVALNLAGPETRVLGVTQAPVRRLFRYEFQPGVVGGMITTDERKYCGLPDGNALVACGFTVEDYMNAPIVPYGQLSMTYTGACVCGP